MTLVKTPQLEPVPVKQAEAFAFIAEHHRHHRPPVGHLFSVAVANDVGTLVGVAVVGRPVARKLDDGLTVEVTRLCTLGHDNACSMLYGMARRIAIEKGYRRGLTYILDNEAGGSLKASGWGFLWETAGGSWSRPSRGRKDKHPLKPKQAYGWGAWPELLTPTSPT